MRYVILMAMLLLCLPVRGEAWQVVVGGAAAAPSYIFADTFDGSTTWWNDISGAVIENGVLKLDTNSAGYPYARNNSTSGVGAMFTPGNTYNYSITVVNGTGGSRRLRQIGNTQDTIVTFGEDGTYVGTFVMVAGFFGFRVEIATALGTGGYMEIDSFYVW